MSFRISEHHTSHYFDRQKIEIETATENIAADLVSISTLIDRSVSVLRYHPPFSETLKQIFQDLQTATNKTDFERLIERTEQLKCQLVERLHEYAAKISRVILDMPLLCFLEYQKAQTFAQKSSQELVYNVLNFSSKKISCEKKYSLRPYYHSGSDILRVQSKFLFSEGKTKRSFSCFLSPFPFDRAIIQIYSKPKDASCVPQFQEAVCIHNFFIKNRVPHVLPITLISNKQNQLKGFTNAFCTRGSLSSQQGQPFSREMCRIYIDVLETLQHIHALGYIHGNLSPKNILLKNIRGGWLTNFSHALSFETSETGGNSSHFPIPPEQFSTWQANGTMDIWMLGMTVLQTLYPKSTSGFFAITARIRKENLKSSLHLNALTQLWTAQRNAIVASLPQNPLTGLIAGMIEINPKKRPSPQELITQFQNIYSSL